MRRSASVYASLALLLLVVAACSHEVADATGPIIDGWRIGTERPCDDAEWCQGMIEAATTALDKREPAHGTIASAALYELRQDPGHTVWRTTGNTAAVFVLADGSRRAIFVGSAAGHPITVDYGP